MDEDSFRDLLRAYLLPLISGTDLGKTRQTRGSHKLVAFKNPCTLLMKPDKGANYRVELFRSQPFTTEEKQLVALFIDQVAEIGEHANSYYFRDLMASVPRRVIGQLLPSGRGRATLQEALQYFESLASQTYEGKPIVAALGITGSLGYGPITLDSLWKEDFSSVLSNGFDTMYVCGSDGRVFNLRALSLDATEAYAPYRHGAVAAWCSDNKRVALVLNRNGEILVFKSGRLQFAKRRGAWRYYAHQPVVSRLGKGLRGDIRQAVYETCLDVSFARTGGCIAVLTREGARKLERHVNDEDRICESRITRTRPLAAALTRPFQKLDRRLRQEIVAMDGATVLTHKGVVETAGAIVRVPGGSTGGGRRAAALQLSTIGLGIKISSDGPITGFRRRSVVFSL